MLRTLARPATFLAARRLRLGAITTTTATTCTYSSATTKASDPLKILFCGSDAFSCESLKALHREHVQNRALVESLDVMVLPPKRTGRGFKHLRQVPCKTLAEELGLRIHQRETFTKWHLPDGINLVIVVSFGLFVPSRILQASKYGGLNVHPSLLPDLRGPAPIHRAMLRGDHRIGISLQTLDDKNFDHGTILAQTPAPGHMMPPRATIADMTQIAGLLGAQMLVQGLRDGLHLPPREDAGWMGRHLEAAGVEGLMHAPKVTKADSQVDWAAWTPEDLDRRIRVFSSLWTRAVGVDGVEKRVILQDAECVVDDDVRGAEQMLTLVYEDGYGRRETSDSETKTYMERGVRLDEATGFCYMQLREGAWVRLKRLKVDGKPEQAAAVALRPFTRGRP